MSKTAYLEETPFLLRFNGYLWPQFQHGNAGTYAIANIGRVYLVPIVVLQKINFDRLCYMCTTTNGNVRMGIYRDGGNTPNGGALIVESASTAMGAILKPLELTVTEATISRGLYWLGFESDVATAVLRRFDQNYSQVGTLQTYYYDRGGGYGAFTDPCPAVAVLTHTLHLWLRISGVWGN